MVRNMSQKNIQRPNLDIINDYWIKISKKKDIKPISNRINNCKTQFTNYFFKKLVTLGSKLLI